MQSHSPSPSPSLAFASHSLALPANQSANLVTPPASSPAGPFVGVGQPMPHEFSNKLCRITCLKSDIYFSLPQPSQEAFPSFGVFQQISAEDRVAQVESVLTAHLIDNNDSFPTGARVGLPVYDNFAPSPNHAIWNPFQPTHPINDSFITEYDIQPSVDNMNAVAMPLYSATPGTDFPFPILQGPVTPKPRTPCQYCMETFTRVPDLARHIQSVHMGIKHHCTYPGCPNNRGKGYCRLEKLRTHQKEKHGFALM
ncbi:hypothetical protein HYALB_00009337 [Hymenoscyphus albidus]|uniref:C2H2-type domain-containing protein n=1 Tax=Hymenoscyphus albidus TaxID=595503 RepID=A0A9N9PWI4_9HELO|nr:hypothetical protein HYALB_00009337 [Hymenoscyphus albidus]